MKKLLDTIAENNEFDLNINFDKIVKNDKLNFGYLHNIISNKIIDLINEYFITLELQNIYQKVDTRKYKIFNTEIVSDTEIEGKREDNRLLVLNITFYKDDKDYHFTIQVTGRYNYISGILNIDEINIIGIKKMKKSYLIQSTPYPKKIVF